MAVTKYGLMIALLTLAIGSSARADVEDGRRLFEEGQRAFETRDYEAALDAWMRSYDESP